MKTCIHPRPLLFLAKLAFCFGTLAAVLGLALLFTPAAQAATLQSATVNGSTLTLTFSQNLFTNTVPVITRFTVAGTASTTSVTAVGFKSGDAKSVELTISPAVAHGDTGITVSYARGNDENPLQSAVSPFNYVADFSGQQVTNNTPAPPDTTAPTVQSATVVGTTLTLTFNEALKTTNAPGTGRFLVAGTASSISVTAVGFKSGDAKSVELTLSPAVPYTDTAVTVSYAKWDDANPLQDTSGNEVANFSSQQVTNNAVPTRPTTCTAVTNPETWLSSVTSTSSSISVTFANPLPGPYTTGNIQLSVCHDGETGWTISLAQQWTMSSNPPTAGQTFTFTQPTQGGSANLTAATDYYVKVTGFYGPGDSDWHFIRTKDAPADTTVPVLQSATVDGSTLTLTYNEALKTTNAPATSRFTVAGTASTTSVTAVGFKSGDAKSVELTLSPAVPHTDTAVTVSYAKGSDANPLQDATGNQVADFSGQQVTNTAGPPTVQSAEVDGVTLTLTFDEALKTTNAPATSRFTVAGTASTTSVTAVGFKSGDAKSVELTLSPAVTAGDSGITVSYAKGSDANPLQDTSSNQVANFSGQQVTNVTGPPTVQSATVNGSTLTLTFNKALKRTGFSTAPWRFTVAGTDRATDLFTTWFSSDDAASFELTLRHGVSAGDTGITVSYAKGTDSNPLQDLAGNEVADFSGQQVKNVTGPPTVQSATVNGSTLTLTYNEALKTTNAPATSRFTVAGTASATTVTAVGFKSGDAKLVELTLSPAVTAGDSGITVSYTQGNDANPLQDLAGNRAANLSGHQVTNVTGDTTAPTVQSATVNRSTLTLTFNEALKTTNAPGATRFTVAGTESATSVTAVGFKGGNAASVELTLSPAVGVDESGITVSYAKGTDANPLQDLAGNQVADFSGRQVTNSTQDTTGQPPSRDSAPSFGGATVAALTLDRGAAMTPVTLPAATGGDGALTYSLTSEPAGLAGLAFDPATRRLTGTPGRAGSWTFNYRADDADANRADSDAAILTFRVQVTILGRALEAVKRTLAGVATRTLTSALGHIGARFANVVPSGSLTLAGQAVNLAGTTAGEHGLHGACALGGFDRHGLGNAHGQSGLGAAAPGCERSSRSVGTEELLYGSAFSVTLSAAEGSGGADPAMPRWSVWGRGDYATFAGRPEGIRYDGEARSGWLGVDARAGRWVAGLALSHGVSEAEYRYEGGDATAGRGRLETTLTALYPYGRWTVGDGLELRGVLGAGTGEARHVLGDGERETGDLGMRMASAGLRQKLPPVAGIDLAARADASVVRMEVGDGPEIIAGVSADSWRVRLGLEASRRFALDGEAALTPFVEAVGRRDGGDGLVGSGLEVAGGVRYSAPGVEVEARGRMLVAHAEEGAREQGVSVTARVGPGANGRGLSLSLNPRWGAATGSAQALWRDEMPRPSATGAGNEAAIDARIGYGFAPAQRGVLTPFAETGLAGGENRRFRLGTRFDASHRDLGMELSGERREGGSADPEHALRLEFMLRF